MQLIYTTEKYIDEFTFDVYIYIYLDIMLWCT